MNDFYARKHLRITEKGFENYTGELSVYSFENGRSLEAIPRVERDRIAATMSCVEVDEQGDEMNAGVAERLVTEAKNRAPETTATERQTENEKSSEADVVAARATLANTNIYSENELDELIAEGGIHALRDVAKQWNLKGRSIPQLRHDVLKAQEDFLTDNEAVRQERMKMIENISGQSTKDTSVESDEVSREVENAAETGDMAAAINRKIH